MTSVPRAPGPGDTGTSDAFTGRTIGRCRIGDRLGRGVTAHLYRAHYAPLGKDIAVKVLDREMAGSAELRARFVSEARAVAKVDHENVIKVLDVVDEQGLICILMELVPGPTLQNRLDDEGALPPLQAVRIGAQIARALEAAHAQKIVHRDVKPANVMLVGMPGSETVKVVDFGLAVAQETNRVGTPLYMSPEAAQGKRVDEKSDVYALGVCLYHMLAGSPPFSGSTVKEILSAHVNAEPEPVSARRPEIGKGFDGLIKKLMVKSKGYRPSAGEAALLLEDMADELEARELGVRRAERRRKATKKKGASPAVVAGVAVGVVVLIAAFAALSGGGSSDASQGGPQVDAGQKLFEETRAWAADNPTNLAEVAYRWKAVETQFPGTKWAELATPRRVDAELAAARKKAQDELAERRRQEEEAAAKDPRVQLAKYENFVKTFRFAEAAAMLDALDPPAGTDAREWARRGNRVEYLRANFVRKLDEGFRDAKPQVKAKTMFLEAKEDEVVVGARSDGVWVADAKGERRTLPWTSAMRESFVTRRVVPDAALDTNDFDNNILLAVLAREFGYADKTKRFLDNARGLDREGNSATVIQSLFGE